VVVAGLSISAECQLVCMHVGGLVAVCWNVRGAAALQLYVQERDVQAGVARVVLERTSGVSGLTG
jgi:hypothetical protein